MGRISRLCNALGHTIDDVVSGVHVFEGIVGLDIERPHVVTYRIIDSDILLCARYAVLPMPQNACIGWNMAKKLDNQIRAKLWV